jgi:hypothetical protein
MSRLPIRLALRLALRLACSAAALAAGCTDVGATRLQIPMLVEGTAPSLIRVADYEVEVEEARVAFGPVYLCTSRLPDVDICPAAIAENLTTTSFDALADAPTQAGTLQGFTQVSRSAMWDYGRTWRIADARPHASAQAVDGAHSAVIVLSATHLGETRHFRLMLDVDGGSQPSGTTAVRARLAEQALTPALREVHVRFDPTLWASMVDYDTLWELPVSETIEVPPGHPAENAMRLAMVLNGLPTFRWVSE